MRPGPRAHLTLLPLAGAFGAATIAVFSGAAAVAATQAVSITNFSYQPSSATVPVGTTVTWTNNDTVTHSVTADGGGFDSSPSCGPGATQSCIALGATFSHTFTVAGTFTYHCRVHGFMHGTITVTAAASSSTTAAPTMPPPTTVSPPTTTGGGAATTPAPTVPTSVAAGLPATRGRPSLPSTGARVELLTVVGATLAVVGAALGLCARRARRRARRA